MPYLYSPQATDTRDGLEPIAICGMGCRLPGQTDSPSALWKLLREKRSTNCSKVPSTRFNIDAHFHPNLDRPGSFNVLGGYFLDGPADEFDPTFFNMTPVEAMWLDPQQRKMLEVCYEALESAGVTLEAVSGSNTGVWAGSFTADYQQMTFKDPDFRHSYAATGVDPGIISNRISNVFDLNGPSCTINTACSSSVYAIHNACNALRARDCDAALVGGVNLILTVDQHMNTAKLGVLSPTSFCHTFDETADGYGRGEGAGALYLKRLDDAMRDGDIVRAVIRSSAVNTNGKVPGYGITYPNVNGQERVIRAAYKRANLDPNDTAYFECHGTGTRVGDPIEVRAVSNAMNDTRSPDRPLVVGAVKPNIGHSEAASGAFAIMKAALMVEAGVIPGVAGLQNVNPQIPEKSLNVKISRDTASWPEGFFSRRASVSSFGYGGTNGHVIVENIEALEPLYRHGARKDVATYDHSSTRPLLMTLSAHDKPTLLRNIAAHQVVADEYYLADLAYTLNQRRTKFSTRGFAIANEDTASDDLATANFKIGSVPTKPIENLAFIFTGQGAQWAGVARHAIKAFSVFRSTIRRMDRLLKTIAHPPNFSIEEQLTAPAETSRINDADVAQPTLVATEMAIVDLLASWGVAPSVTIGHSAGEYAAAYAAGLASAPELIIAAYYRGYALRKHAPTTGGAMLAIGLGAEDVTASYLEAARLHPDVVIACENSPRSVTLSGPAGAIAEAKAVFDADNVFARELRTGGMAYHSPHMEAVAGPMVELTRKAYKKLDSFDRQWRCPRRVMISSVTGGVVCDGEINPGYWAANLTGRVRFDGAVASMPVADLSLGAVLETGPHSALAGPFKQICQGQGRDELRSLTYIPTLIRNQDSAKSLLRTAGELFLSGYTPLDLARVNHAESRGIESPGFGHKRPGITPLPLVDLPPYQWNYDKTYWAEPRASAEYRQLQHARHDLLGSKILGLASQAMAWRNVLRVKDVPWLAQHRLGGSNMFPAAGHMALAVEAARQHVEMHGDGKSQSQITGATLRNMELKTALIVPDSDDGLEIQTRLTQISSDSYRFTVSSCNPASNTWSIHSEGEIALLSLPPSTSPHPVDLTTLTQRHTGKRWNTAFRRVGFEYLGPFNTLSQIRTNGSAYSAAATMAITDNSGAMTSESRYALHPSTVDSLLQLCIVSIFAGDSDGMPWGVVPVKFEELTLRFPTDDSKMDVVGEGVAWNPVRVQGARRFRTDARLARPDGRVVLSIRGLETVAYEAALPPKGEGKGGVELGPMPFAGVVWRGDVEMMGVDDLQNVVGGQAAVEALPKLVELIHHKKPVGSVLIIDGDGDLVGVVDGIQAKVSLASQISVCGGRGYDDAKESPRVKKLEYPEGGTDDMAASLGVGKQDLVVFTVKETARLLHDKDLLATYASLFDAGSKGLCHVDGEESIRQLRRHLEGAGFSVSNEFPLGGQSIIIFSLRSEKEVEVEEESHPKINLVYSNLHSAPPLALADALAKQGLAVEIKTLESESDVEGLLVGTATKKNSPLTLLYNPAGTMLSRPDPTTFAALKALLPSGSPTLWLTAGVNGGQCTSAATVAGFLRVVREEEKMANVRVLDFDKHETFASVAKAVGAILRTDGNGGENEYWLHKGVVHVSRIVPNLRLCDRMDVVERAAVEAPLPVDKALRGRLINGDGVVFTHNEVLEKSTPADGEVDIQVESTELYKGDVQAVTPEERTRLVCGKVVAIGAGVEKAMLGKSVVGFVRASNPYDTVVRSQATLSVECESESGAVLLSLLPSLCEAAAALELGSGAALEQKPVLLLPTTKSLGRAFSLLSARLGFGLTVVEDGGNLSGIYQAMETSGSSLVIAAAAFSPLASDLWRRIPSGGASFCLMDGGASLSTTALDTTPFTRGARFSTTSIASILGSSTPESATTIQKILSVVVPVAQEATSTLDSQQSQILTLNSLRSPISFPPDTPTILSYTYNSPTTPIKLTPPPFTLQFSDSGIYLLVGCLGGLGRSLASFLTARGARHLAFISRSGSSSASASALIDSITATTGVTPLVFRGDASDVNDVSRVVRSIRDSGRTIKGVVHAAMVLQDGILSNMTTDKMDASLRPKVDGAYALREVLEAEGADGELDFFVMTSSISATVGQPGQANYAAGNAVLDSVAVQMGRRGKAGVYTSLVLPMVLGVGVVAENDELEGKIARRGMYGIDEGEMLRAFEAAMSMSMGGGVSSEGVQMDAAIVLGLDPTRLAGTWAAAEAEDMAVETSWMSDDARFSHLRQISDAVLGKDESGGGAKKSGGGGGFAEQVADAHASGGFEAAVVVTAGCIMTKCGSVLMLPADGFELDGRSVASYGLDSMVGAELRNWLFKELGLNIAFQDLLATTLSFRGLSKLVLDGFGISE